MNTTNIGDTMGTYTGQYITTEEMITRSNGVEPGKYIVQVQTDDTLNMWVDATDPRTAQISRWCRQTSNSTQINVETQNRNGLIHIIATKNFTRGDILYRINNKPNTHK